MFESDTFLSGEERRSGGRFRGDGFENRIAVAEGFWDRKFDGFKRGNNLQCVDHALTQIVIVRDDEGFASLLDDAANPLGPGSQLFGRIEIIVALVRRSGRIVGKPRVVATPMKPHVAEGRRGLVAGLDGTPNNRLINVAKRGALLAEQREE